MALERNHRWRLSGTNRPFANRCDLVRKSILLSSDAAGKQPLAQVSPHGVSLSFHLSTGKVVAWVDAEDPAVRASGYADLSHEPFRLRADASLFDGHVKLRRHAPVNLSSVGDKTVE